MSRQGQKLGREMQSVPSRAPSGAKQKKFETKNVMVKNVPLRHLE